MIKKESGQSMVLVAIAIVLLFGFGALGVDIGAEVAFAQRLQRAASAAALAGAEQLLAGSGDVSQQVYTYVNENGVPSSAVSQMSIANGQVKVTLTAPHYFYLAPAIGFRSVLIKRSAIAATGLPSVFDWAIFAGDTSNPVGTGSALYVNVNHVNVTGNIHSNSDIYVNANNGNGGDNSITGVADASGVANISSNVTVARVSNGTHVLNMPDFSKQIENQAKSDSQIYSDGWSNNNTCISGTVWVQGNATIYTNNVKGAGCVFASGSIDVYANNTNDGDSDMAYYSEGGNITIHTNNVNVNGIFYAPNGTITIEPESQTTGTTTVDGSLVAKDISIDSNQLDIDSTNGSNSLMPRIAYLVN